MAGFQFDLDQRLHYSTGLVALTNQRFLATCFEAPAVATQQVSPQLIEGNGAAATWQSWPVVDGIELRTWENGGIGAMELRDANRRLAIWRFTAAAQRDGAQLRSILDHAANRAEKTSRSAESLPTVCPSCGEVITSDDRIVRRLRRPSAAADRHRLCIVC